MMLNCYFVMARDDDERAGNEIAAFMPDMTGYAIVPREHYDRLRAIEAALPKTRDGVAIVPETVVWYQTGDGKVRSLRVGGLSCRGHHDAYFADCYSTEAAARSEQERPPCAKSCCGGM